MNRAIFSSVIAANNAIKLGLTAAALVALFGISAPAHAQAGTTTFTIKSGAESDSISYTTNGGKNYESVSAGRYQSTLGTTTLNVFCTDASHNINYGQSYQANTSEHITDAAGSLSGGYYSGGLGSALNAGDYGSLYPAGSPTAAQRASETAWLTDAYLGATAQTFSSGLSGSTVLTDNLAAVQLSIWDINQDGGDGMTAGNLQLASAYQTTLDGLVSYYEKQASYQTSYQSSTATWIQAPVAGDGTHLQDFVELSPAPVPEPGVLVTGASLIGMTGLGLIRGRRRQRVADAQPIAA